MKKILIPLFALMFVSMTFAAQESVDVDIDVEVANSFLWRGRVLNEEAVIQPSATFSSGDVMLIFWGTWDLTDVEHSSDHTRTDITLDYTFVAKSSILSVGGKAYIFPDDSANDDTDDPRRPMEDTFEAYVSCAFDMPLLPSLTIYYDFTEYEALYANLGFGHSFDLGKRLSMDVQAGVSYGDEEYCNSFFTHLAVTNEVGVVTYPGYEPEGAKLLDATVSASFPFKASKSFTFTPSVEYMALLDDELKDEAKLVDEEYEHLLYSLTLGLSF